MTNHTPTESPQRLGEALITAGHITRDQLEQGLAQQKNSGKFIGETLVELGFIAQDHLTPFLVKFCKIPYVSLLDYLVDESLLQYVSKETCTTYRVLPVDKMGRNLTIAMVNPLDARALTEIQNLNPDLRLKPILCEPAHYDVVVNRLFGGNAGPDGDSVSMESLGLSAKSAARPKPTAPSSKAETSRSSPNNRADSDKSLMAAVNDVTAMAQESMNTTYEVLARRLALFHGLEPDEVAGIFNAGATMEVQAGSVIFEKGAEGKALYVILHGAVRILDDGKEIALLTAGDMVGEMGLVTGEIRSATAVAAHTTSLFVLDEHLYQDLLTKRVAIRLLLNIIGAMSGRLRGANDILRSLVR